jgi:hypothetical protein
MSAEQEETLAHRLIHGNETEEAVRAAVEEAKRLHKRMGVPMHVVLDGVLVTIQPEDIEVEDGPCEYPFLT